MKKRCLALLLTLVLCIGMAIPAGASQFQDVPDGHWASDAVDYVVEKGLFNGTSATTFSPDSGMTRAMLTVVLYRYAGSPRRHRHGGQRDPLPGHPRRGVLWGRCGVGLPERHLPRLDRLPGRGGP